MSDATPYPARDDRHRGHPRGSPRRMSSAKCTGGAGSSATSARTAPTRPKLTPEQDRVASWSGGPVVVSAGAGTGKTGTLAATVVALVQGGVNPRQVLLLTFTRKAARESIRRASSRAGPDPEEIKVSRHRCVGTCVRRDATLAFHPRIARSRHWLTTEEGARHGVRPKA